MPTSLARQVERSCYCVNLLLICIAIDKPGEPVFSQCAFDKLTWLPSISKTSVKYTLQAKEVSGIWFDILTSSDTMYSPSTNETLSNSKDYEFRVVASNCVGSTESKICSVTGRFQKDCELLHNCIEGSPK